MSKKSALIFISITLLMIIAGLGYFYYAFVMPKAGEGDGIQKNLMDYLPFGKPADKTAPETTTTQDEPVEIPTSTSTASTTVRQSAPAVPILRHITNTPIAGATSFDNLIRYVDRGTGHIFETSTSTLVVTKISNTTIPKIYEAYFGAKGSSVILRYLNENESIQTFLGALSKTTTTASSTDDSPYKLVGSFLPLNIDNISVSPSKDSFFYIIMNEDSASGISSSFSGKNKKEIFTSDFRDWLGQWSGASTVTLTTKPSAVVGGYAYFLNTANGAVTKIIDATRGLTALTNPTGAYILYSNSTDGSIGLNLFTVKSGQGTYLSGSTLPEKCVWSKKETSIAYCAVPVSIPSASYPDAWYQGLVSFNDNVWRIDASTGSARNIFTIQSRTNDPIDAINLFLSDKEDTLFFTNKRDLTLWSLNLIVQQ